MWCHDSQAIDLSNYPQRGPQSSLCCFYCTKTYKSTLKALVVTFFNAHIAHILSEKYQISLEIQGDCCQKATVNLFLSGKRVTSYLSRQWKDLHKAPSYAKLFGNAPQMGLIDKEHSLLFFLSKSIIWLVRPCWFHVTWFWFPFLCRKLKNNVNNGPNLSTKPRMSN